MAMQCYIVDREWGRCFVARSAEARQLSVDYLNNRSEWTNGFSRFPSLFIMSAPLAIAGLGLMTAGWLFEREHVSKLGALSTAIPALLNLGYIIAAESRRGWLNLDAQWIQSKVQSLFNAQRDSFVEVHRWVIVRPLIDAIIVLEGV